uniref:FLYWCH-type domain-containing protein n=1 Tax=Parascaris univalens TaxID=6257 RepID=A0A915AH22_PARUN
MGCLLARILDPAPPEPSTKYFWHVEGAYFDATRHSNRIKKKGAGVLYVHNGRLWYKSRCYCNHGRRKRTLQIDICNIERVLACPRFSSNADSNKEYSGPVIDVCVNDGTNSLHAAFKTKDAESISSELNEICLKHRQKPKIFQFNSVDVEGVEIDLP